MKIRSLCKEENEVLPLNLPQECLTMVGMGLRHRVLLLIVSSTVAACSTHGNLQDSVDEGASPYARDVTLQNWTAVLKATSTSTSELSNLLNDYALFQMGKFSELVARPLQAKDLFYPSRAWPIP